MATVLTRYKKFGIKLNKDGEYDIYTPEEMQQPAKFREIDFTVDSLEIAKQWIDCY